MASIQQLKSALTGEISYRAQVRVKGQAAQSKTFPNKKEAQQWAQSVEAAIRENRHFPHARAARTTFAELVERYFSSSLDGLTETERAARRQQLTWWVKQFVGRTLSEITTDRVAEARDALASETYTRGKERTTKAGERVPPKERKRSGATVNRYLAALSHLFTIAIRDWRLLDKNPVRDISKKKESRGRTRFLTDEERAELLKACAASAWKPLETVVLLALSTGARRGEIINLKWTDVDLKAQRALVRDSKNGDPRQLPLVGRSLELLRTMKLQNSARSEYVFPQPSGFPAPYENFDTHWYAALDSAGIGDLRFHDLRHTTASYLAQQGASLLEIADTLGHRTMAMVKRYSHLAQSHKVTAIEKMAKERGL
jgi:integrase